MIIYFTISFTFIILCLFASYKARPPKIKIEKQTEDQVIIKPKLNPIYDDLLNCDNIAKLKIDILNTVSTVKQPKLKEDEKKYIIGQLLESVPKALQYAIKEGKDVAYIFPLSIPTKSIISFGSCNVVFEQVYEDLILVLKEAGITVGKYSGLSGIILPVDELMKWCNYERLITLK